MRSIKMTFTSAMYYLRQWIVNPRIYISLILMVCLSLLSLNDFVTYAKSIDEPYNAFEPFILLYTSPTGGYMIFLALLIMFSDAPFMRPGQAYYMLRIGRRRFWFLGQVVYILCLVVCSMLVLLVFNLIVFGSGGYFGDFWSQPYFNISNNSADILLKGSVELAQSMRPFTAMLHAFLLSCCYSLFLSLLLYLLNLRNKKTIGFGIVSLLHIVSTFAFMNAQPSINRWLPFTNAIVSSHAFAGGGVLPTLSQSYLYFLAAIVILSIFLILRLKKQDMEVGDVSGL